MRIFKLSVFIFLFLILTAENIYAQETTVNTAMIDSMTVLIFQLGIIIFASRLGGMLFERMGMPAILGELISGMIIGPYALGGIRLPIINQPLFPLSGDFPISPQLYGFTTVASIVLLFMAGLETDPEIFLKYSLAGSVVGIGGVIASFLFGDIVTVIFSKYLFATSYGFLHPVPMLLGVVSTATSVGITARILSERKKMHSPEGVTIVSAAIIDDVLGIIVLAIAIAIAKSRSIEWASIGRIAFKSISFWLGFTLAGFLLSKHISNMLKRFKDTTTITIMGFGLALILAGIFEKAGLAMIIGAYVMGLSLSRTDLDYVMQEKLSAIHRFFVPLFFCVMGMLVNFSTFTSKHVLFFGLFYSLACILGKIIGCGLPALFLSFNLRGAMRVGLGMMPRGEVALLVTGVGLSTGVLKQETLGVSIFMILITTLITPSILSMVLKSDKPVLRKEIPVKEGRKEIIFDIPTPEAMDLILSEIVSIFDNEGFFIQRLDTGERLYQIRRDETFIGLEASSNQLRFDCKQAEAVFIHTIVYEVLAELENITKKLHAFTDEISLGDIGRKIFDKDNGKKLPKPAGFIKHIDASALEVNLKGTTKQQIIEEMLDILIRSGQLMDSSRQVALKDLFEREAVVSTGMQYGIAMPHAKTDVVDHLVYAIGIKRDGIDFDSLDKEPSKIFIIILSPKNMGGPHVRFMADISQFLMDGEKRQCLISAETNMELYQAIIS